jgi:hypothetical protein
MLQKIIGFQEHEAAKDKISKILVSSKRREDTKA